MHVADIELPESKGAIRVHNENTGESHDTKIRQAIYAIDPLTGLMVASALVSPDKKLKLFSVDFLWYRFQRNFLPKERGARRFGR